MGARMWTRAGTRTGMRGEPAAAVEATAPTETAVTGNRRMREAAQAGPGIGRGRQQHRGSAGTQQGGQQRGPHRTGQGHVSGLR